MTQATDALELERDLALSRLASPRLPDLTDEGLDARARVVRAVVSSSYYHAHDRRRGRELARQAAAPAPAPPITAAPSWLSRILPALALVLVIAAAIATPAIASETATVDSASATMPAPEAPAPIEAPAPAETPEPAQTPAPFEPEGLELVNVTVPAEWRAEANTIADELAQAAGYPRPCGAAAGNRERIVANLPAIAHVNAIGLAWTGGRGSCIYAVAPSELVDRCAYLRVSVHELLHLARNDGWHADPSDSANPLGGMWTPPGCSYAPGASSPAPTSSSPATTASVGTAPLLAVYGPITRAEAKAAIANRLGRRWRVSVCGTQATGSRLELVNVCAKRTIKRPHRRALVRHREYDVVRLLSGRLDLERIG